MRKISTLRSLYRLTAGSSNGVIESLLDATSVASYSSIASRVIGVQTGFATLQHSAALQATINMLGRRSFSSLPPHTELAMPSLSPTMEQGNLVEWKVAEGQEVAAGDILADVETDKAVLGWENQDDGFVAKLLVGAGTKDIRVGEPVLILVDDESQVAAFKDYQPSKGGGAATPTAEAAAASSTSSAPAASASTYEVDKRVGPAARMLLQEAGLAATSVKPSGPHGIVTKGDVLDAVKNGTTAPAPASAAAATTPAASTPPPPPAAAAKQAEPAKAAAAPTTSTPSSEAAEYTDIPTTQIRRIIADRLLESKSTIPHLYISADVSMDGVTAMREALKQQGSKVSVNDFVIKAVAMALRDVPAANSMWDNANEVIQPLPSVDISIAVATEGGLITPIIKNADGKSLTKISAEVKELAGRARANKLKPEEFLGGSFSISNLGMYGVDSFYAIINPPQACIMAVGTGRKETTLEGGQLGVESMMTVTLSADHRVFDGGVASDLLDAFKSYMKSPLRLVNV